MPGLMLGLERGGSCRGIAFRIAGRIAEGELRLIWMREMISGAYRPRWVTVRTARGPLRAVVFVANPHYPLYAGRLPPATEVHHIAHAAGSLGTCRAYLENTLSHLHRLGLADSYLSRLHRLVQTRAAGPGGLADAAVQVGPSDTNMRSK